MIAPEVRWHEPEEPAISPQVLTETGGSLFLAQALARREITDAGAIAGFLNPTLYTPRPPSDLPDLNLAADLIETALRAHQPVAVWGDFDVDGQTATTILYQSLLDLGGKVSFHIPVRGSESHGVNLENLNKLLQAGAKLVVTCDTGISAHDAAAFMAEKGLPLVITDHHSLPEILPAAPAVVSSQRLAKGHPLSYLCGAGVAYMLAQELYQRFGIENGALKYLDLVALGTIADLAILKGDNRYLVQMGLQNIRRGPRPALKALFDIIETDYALVGEEQISFNIAPRLNALGRLGDSNLAVPFLTGEDTESTRSFALELDKFNIQRKTLTDQVFQASQSQIQHDPGLLRGPVLLLSHPSWPGGVIGIVASKLAELYHRPVVMISAPPGQPARGSARSVEGIDITAALEEFKDHLLSFGGHPMAAGFSVSGEDIPALRANLNLVVEKITRQAPIRRDLVIDAFVPLDQVTLDMVEDFEKMAPFGPGNPPVILACRDLLLKSYSSIGKTGEHLQLLVEDSAGLTRKVIWWQGAGNPLPDGRFDLAFTVRASNYKGERALQMEWNHARPISQELPVRVKRPHVKTMDFRQSPDPAAELARILPELAPLIWAEGETPPPVASANRFQLVPGAALVLWNIPPGLDELRTILETVSPRTIAFFGVRSNSDQPQDVLKRVGGMLRYSLRTAEGSMDIRSSAAALCQRQEVIRRAVDWWIAHGDVHPVHWDERSVQVAIGGVENRATRLTIEAELSALLKETTAFRAFFLRALPEQLLE